MNITTITNYFMTNWLDISCLLIACTLGITLIVAILSANPSNRFGVKSSTTFGWLIANFLLGIMISIAHALTQPGRRDIGIAALFAGVSAVIYWALYLPQKQKERKKLLKDLCDTIAA